MTTDEIVADPSAAAPEPLTTAEASLGHAWQLVVGNELTRAASGRTYPLRSPATGELVAHVPDGGPDDVAAAVEAGRRAQPEWAKVTPRERAAVVRRLAEVARDHREELAALDALAVGNALTPMVQDVMNGADGMDFMAEAAVTLTGQTIPATPDHLHYTVREPYGVVARIVAFNHPVMFALQKIAAPLVAGNAVILKPSDLSPLSALRMGELFAPLLPPGLLSVLVGQGADLPRAIVAHPRITRIGFIGSEGTGRAIQRDAAEAGVKNVTLELGGKNAIVVCPDVDIAAAADGVVKGMNFIGWQSQSCSSTSRLLVHEDIADELVAAVVERAGRVRIGDPLDPDTQMGSLSGQAQLDKTLGFIAGAVEEGATLVAGGGQPADRPTGCYVEPTVLDHVQPDMRIAREEVFGPVLSVIRWTDEDEAVRIANDVEFGLTGAVWSQDIDRAHRIAHALETGYVWINDAAAHYTGIPFGGYKASGVGHEESIEELLSYSRLKTVNMLVRGR